MEISMRLTQEQYDAVEEKYDLLLSSIERVLMYSLLVPAPEMIAGDYVEVEARIDLVRISKDMEGRYVLHFHQLEDLWRLADAMEIDALSYAGVVEDDGTEGEEV